MHKLNYPISYHVPTPVAYTCLGRDLILQSFTRLMQ